MKVKRIIANIFASQPSDVDNFYQGILGLEVVMDHGWIRTYAGSTQMAVQISFANDLAPLSPDTVYAQCSAAPSGWFARR
ncbi:MAG: hypothetical protein ACRERR_02050 [Moraxellaceae bacterium]